MYRKGVIHIPLTQRQEKIVEIVRAEGPITGKEIARRLNVTRAALRSDLAVLTMSGIIDARPKVGYYYLGKNSHDLLAEAVGDIVVRDIQSLPVVMSPTASAYEAIVTMFLEDVGSIYIADGTALLGVVSRKDLLKVSAGHGDLQKIPVKMLMTAMPKVVTATPDESVLSAARKLIDHEVDSLPVVRSHSPGDGQVPEVIGRISKTSITRLFVEMVEGKRR